MAESDNLLDQLKENLNLLISQRELFEIEANAIYSELTSIGPNGEPPAGIKEALVDSEGFPRSDIDIINVKNKRKRLAEINTDHNELMKKIEILLPQIHHLNSQKDTRKDVPPKQSESAQSINDNNMVPFAKIDEVLLNSPAKISGLMDGDYLVSFGKINSQTPSYLNQIASLVGNSINSEIKIKIMRNNETMDLILIPRPWGGRGLLGCHLTPI